MKEATQVSVNRRSFLKGGAVLATGAFAAASIGLTGCQPATKSEKTESANASDLDNSVLYDSTASEAEFRNMANGATEESEDWDVVVIGAGTSGTCAALSAAQQGAKVVIVEKTKVTGGMSNYSRMIAGTNTSLQKEMNRTIETDDLYKAMRDDFRGTNNLPLVRSILDASAENIDWLLENGLGMIAEPEELTLQPGLPSFREKCGHMMTGSTREAKTPNDATDSNFKGLYNTYFEDWGGSLMLETRAVELLTEEDGNKVAGVVCEKKDGSRITLNAKAVILAAGSWDGNTSYLKDVLAGTDRFMINSGGTDTQDTGDGVYLAEQIGGHRWITTPVWHQVYYAEPDGSVNMEIAMEGDQATLRYNPGLVWVNAEGTRFVDESITGAFAQRGSAAYSQAGDLWVVFDQAAIEDIEANGSGENVYPINRMEAGCGIVEKVQQWVKDGHALSGKSIEDLAEQAGFDADEFAFTVETYNEAVEAKSDKLFLKDASHLRYPLATAPFYAIRMIANSEGGAIGGVRVNRDLKVFRKDTGKTFANLFAVGQNSSGFFGYGAYVDIMGMTMGYATCSGRLAGITAAEISQA